MPCLCSPQLAALSADSRRLLLLPSLLAGGGEASLTPAGAAWLQRLEAAELLLPHVGDSLAPLAPLLQLSNLTSVLAGSCQCLARSVSEPLAAARGLRRLSLPVRES